MKEIRSYVSSCKFNSSSKLLVKEETVPFDPQNKEKIVVPSWFIYPLLTTIHQDQSCPEPNQLKKVFERYFHGYQLGTIFKEISENCSKCQARKKVPKEFKEFKSVTNPSSPGENFVSDVMKRSKQLILVTRDAFSDFVTTSFIPSEKAQDLKEGLIATTNPVRKWSALSVRVDSAPGFLSLENSNDKDLQMLKIQLDLSHPEIKMVLL